jgi:hypothetical protein
MASEEEQEAGGEYPPPLSVRPSPSTTPEPSILSSSVNSTPLATNRKTLAMPSLTSKFPIDPGYQAPNINTTPKTERTTTTSPAVLSKMKTPLPLLCCFYAEFDNKVGPRVCYQSPKKFMEADIRENMEGFEQKLDEEFQRLIVDKTEHDEDGDNNNHLTGEKISDDTESGSSDSIFDSCSEYIITGHELVANIINLSTHNLHVLTRPTMIADEKYERNSLLFCVGFVLRRSIDPRPFRPVLSKIAVTLRDMEVESQFLSNQRKQIQTLLENLLVSLNSETAECNLLLGPADVLNLKLFRPPRMPTAPVQDHQVPILLRRDWQVQTVRGY